MSYFQSFSNCYDNNHDADDSSTVFEADTVMPREVPSLPPLPTLTATATAAATTDYLYNNNVTISSSPHSSQKESPQSFTSEFLRLINSQRSLAISSTTTATATATKSEEISTNESSSSSSKKRTITTNSSSHQSRKRPRQRSRRKRQQPQDQNCTENKSDSEVEDENGLEDYEPDETVINQSSSSSSSPTSSTTKLTKHELKWKSKFEEMCDYKRLHGHTNVPRNNKELGAWVNSQRTQYKYFQANKKAYITKERIEKLESIDFEWVSSNKPPRNESLWNERLNELKAYKELHGHTNVPDVFKSNKELGKWVSKQRREYKKFQAKKKSQTTPERIQTLESIGFEWVSPNQGGPRNESSWNNRFNELKEYKEKYDHTNVSRYGKDNKQLGEWVNTQRKQYKKFQANKKSSMTSRRIEILESIDFEWVSPNKGGQKKS